MLRFWLWGTCLKSSSARDVVGGCHADDVADAGDGDGGREVPAAVAEAVGGPCDGDGRDTGAEVGREGDDEGDDARVAEAANDGWVEVGEAVGG